MPGSAKSSRESTCCFGSGWCHSKSWRSVSVPDPKTDKDLGREIRKYFIPDFSNWKDHDSYQTAFQRLVKDLKAEASK